MIEDYLDTLEGTLGFDRALARRVRLEVEDHLREAVAEEPAGDPSGAERRAVARFGDPRAVARPFVALSLARHGRRSALAGILAIAGIFAAMKIRVASYAPVAPHLGGLRDVADLALLVDRFAFQTSVILALVAGLYLWRRVLPNLQRTASGRPLRGFIALHVLSTTALMVSIAADCVLTALRPTQTLIALASLAAEAAAAAALVICLSAVIRRNRSAGRLLDA
jgi:cysteine sulfinate desulfinase/cysteine desulfurase-like protein